MQPYIERYLVLDFDDARVNYILPDTALVMAFRFKGLVDYTSAGVKTDLSPFVVSGLRRTARHINYHKGAGNVLVIFKEGGAAAFFKEPLHELFNESVPLDNFNRREELSRIEDQLNEALDQHEQVAVIERFLLSKLHPHQPDLLIMSAVQKIRATKGLMRVKDLAAALCISQDAFEKRFRRLVGSPPKQFATIIRLRTLLETNTKPGSFTDLAFDAGYFDQAHFNRDFKLFTGQSPTDFFRAPAFW